ALAGVVAVGDDQRGDHLRQAGDRKLASWIVLPEHAPASDVEEDPGPRLVREFDVYRQVGPRWPKLIWGAPRASMSARGPGTARGAGERGGGAVVRHVRGRPHARVHQQRGQREQPDEQGQPRGQPDPHRRKVYLSTELNATPDEGRIRPPRGPHPSSGWYRP